LESTLYFSIYRPEEHIDLSIMPGDNLHQPDCRLFSELEYSFHAFEHLEVRKIK